MLNGTNPVLLLNELRELGECCILAQTDSIPCLDEMDPALCFLSWDIILSTTHGIDAIKDVFIFVEDDSDITIELISEEELAEEIPNHKNLGTILIERGDATPEMIEQVLEERKRIGELLVDAQIVSPEKVDSALAEQQQLRQTRRQKATQETASSIRVPADRLDLLVNLVGELVTVQARLSQTSHDGNYSQLPAIAEEVERLTRDLRDTALNIRMLPIGTTFGKFKRLVRDLSQELGKDIVLETSGAETELDKTVLEKLNDPLVHLIRNSIDHGIESPEERTSSGKPSQGTVHLAAAHSGDSVLITINDDGRGLDKGKILAKAIEKGIVSPEVDLSDKEIFNLVLAPGFSTAQTISNVSGRGVGMDVVKQAIEELRGTIDIHSDPGSGSTITLKIPLTLAIIESLLVRIGDDRFALPLSLVEECDFFTPSDGHENRHLARFRDQIVSYIPLREHFGIPGKRPEAEHIVLTTVDGQRVGLVVDYIIGDHQAVIKTLGKIYRDVKGISGSTILGDGEVALIVDIPTLIHAAELEEEAIL